MSDHTIAAFTRGTHNLINPELIPTDAAQDSLGWVTKDARLVLSYGRNITGNDSATSGKICGVWFGYKIDGSKVMYRKTSTKIQYLNGSTWTDIITGLTANSDYTAPNYSSLAGTFTFFVGVDGIWKVHNANPTSPINLTSSTKNFKGKAIIDRGRMILWGRPEDRTGLYGSHIDRQDSTVYTTVTGEATAASGTLAGGAGTQNVFGVTITVTGTGEVFTDNYMGVLTGSLGSTGTINYATGAYVLTTGGGIGTADYQWEDSNDGSITDFTKSATRLAGEGFQFPQDEGGDAILNVLIGQDGTYYSEKSQSFYNLSLDETDLAATNLVYRKDIGIPSFRAGIATNKGIVFMNTANPAKPEMTILQRNVNTNNVEPLILFPHFKFSNYNYDDCDINTYERYITVLCRRSLSQSNDVILLCDLVTGIVDVVQYSGRCSAKDSGNFYVGHNLIENVYQLFNGFDDDGVAITNYWISKKDQFQGLSSTGKAFKSSIGENLKKYRKQRIKGNIDPSQKLQVWIDCDGSGFQLVGTILGTGEYVDYSSPQAMGSNMIGQSQIGGDDSNTVAYPYFTELKVKLPKFRTRTIKLIATGIGYVDVEFLSDWDLLIFEQRLPTRFRQKQNVSLDGETTDIPQS